MKPLRLLSYVLLLATNTVFGQSGQINLPRVDMMPNEPAPYNVRDWRQVALRYDSFVYDLTKTGQYLPLVSVQASGFNYPQNPAYRMHTYVGTNSPQNGEAINMLPSLVGASLIGIDKSNQFGRNWVQMSQDFFNKNNGEGIYLNNPNSGSGNDWWYDLMPNVFFYQLYDLYPDMGGEADVQFRQIADRFAEAVRNMGGSATPWNKAFMNYRAWNFKTQQPNTTSVPEPEAAGAFAWVLYNAYLETGNPEYLQAAEWSLEFLNEWPTNPSYELQLPYGVYVAARMNAELGTHYNLEKMVNWTFDRGSLRGWGAIVGKWGGFDVHGLIGEANDAGNDYAFQLNGVQQAAMLAPMVRYDKRFARAIGKWMLNLSNATRLFYPNFLPGSLQDGAAWSNVNDPERVIGHEALREKYQNLSPYATGDALGGGWAGTNLSLYSTASIGYLGALVEKTDVDKILKIDLLQTDFFHASAFPTFLLFNPYAQTKTVTLATGNAPVDVYDAISETFLLQGVTGMAAVTVPANQALLVTLTPAGGIVTYDRNKMLVNGTVVDYRQSAQPFAYAPRIQALATALNPVEFSDTTAVFSKTFDQDSNNLTWEWQATGGTLLGSGATVQWIAPTTPGNHLITLIVQDESGQRDTATVQVQSVAEVNLPPQILNIDKSALYTMPGDNVGFTVVASDANADPLSYQWTSSGGSLTGSGATRLWTAPATEGIFQIQVTATDPGGLSAQRSTTILVKNFDGAAANLIAHYPFLGNMNDMSGNNLHGQASGGALIVPDFDGTPASACRFDGVNDLVTVPNEPLLNFQQGITATCWFKLQEAPDHETFLLSHGSWQNRWKVSITPERKLRWTVNSIAAIADLDSDVEVVTDSVYHVAVTYDGALMALYLNGALRTYKPLSGLIRTASVPFLMGQMLPGNTDFNFKGILDEVKIYDFALPPAAIEQLFGQGQTSVFDPKKNTRPIQIFPNPGATWVQVSCPEAEGTIRVVDLTGNVVWEQNNQASGLTKIDSTHWNTGIYIFYFQSKNMVSTARFVKI